MPPLSWTVSVRHHPGSAADDVVNEPDWAAAPKHYIGVKDGHGTKAGITHQKHVDPESLPRLQRISRRLDADGAMDGPGDSEHCNEQNTQGWRQVLQLPQMCRKAADGLPSETEEKQSKGSPKACEERRKSDQQEHEWRASRGQSKHNGAYLGIEDTGYDSGIEQSGPVGLHDPEPDKLLAKYTPQEIALLCSVRHEREYMSQLRVNDGKGTSPQHQPWRTQTSIDVRDQLTPDNWFPRSPGLIRLTGTHPFNAEPQLSHLFDAGLITPNELHHVRNHGAVPRLSWEHHRLVVQGGKLSLSMEELKNSFIPINIPVMLASAGNRRKELDAVRKSKGFGWGAGAVGCAYWKGPLLHDVLLSAGVSQDTAQGDSKRYWVHFEGADEPSEGKYATCLPLEYAMDPKNDVQLAMEMNDVPLPPDQGYPLRLIVPGHIDGRSIKWLQRIWVSDRENESHYHVWDNRLLPSFVTEKDGEFADALFHLSSTACNEQILNSVIVKPAHGETVPFAQAQKGQSYRIAGYAYSGGGREVQRVEVSLDDGQTWFYCVRQYPDYPLRHGNKFWTWLHWHLDIELSYLLRARSITVRCFDATKSTQPRKVDWNVLGLMNNSWYVVRASIAEDEEFSGPSIRFEHPVQPGLGAGGWLKPLPGANAADLGPRTAMLQKQFTREEIEAHDREDDCWIVIDGRVYDVTSVLSWHPGGNVGILGHAGKLHQAASDEFAAMHDSYAYHKLDECVLGVVTDKAASHIKRTKSRAGPGTYAGNDGDQPKLRRDRWIPVRFIARHISSVNGRTYTFALPEGQTNLGLGTCQYLQFGFHLPDRMLIRSHTPTRPLLPAPKHSSHQSTSVSAPVSPLTTRFSFIPEHSSPSSRGARRESLSHSLRDGLDGTFDITIPGPPCPRAPPPSRADPGTDTAPSESAESGAQNGPDDYDDPFATLLSQLDPGSTALSCRGPLGSIVYHGCGAFTISEGDDDGDEEDENDDGIKSTNDIGRRAGGGGSRIPADEGVAAVPHHHRRHRSHHHLPSASSSSPPPPSSSFYSTSFLFSRISLVLADSPEAVARGYALVARVLLCADPTPVRVVVVVADGNGEDESGFDGVETAPAFLRDELDEAVARGRGQVRVVWARRGEVDQPEAEDIKTEDASQGKGKEVGGGKGGLLRRDLFAPGDGAGAFVCGEAGLIKGWALPGLKGLGYQEGVDLFGL